MTNEELLYLKALAQRAQPFTGESVDEPVNDEWLRRVEANGEFFVAAHQAIPALVDELIKLRSGMN
ncbi:MAG: hypothetical protein FOGNACKC_00907 [Anaerolineae bacterium]|nr:hypothetical protein [Anaerolineae bacterium]